MTEAAWLATTPRILVAELRRKQAIREAEQRTARLLAEWRVGVFASLMLNAVGSKTEAGASWRPHDIFPDLPTPEVEERRADLPLLMQMVGAMNARLGGKDERVRA